MRVGTLIDTPLNTVMTLDKNIHTLADLKGKKSVFPSAVWRRQRSIPCCAMIT
ncbi:hypothetical protein SODG_002450 [Sodalis praecaptivus]